ncbi:lytic transglycosylase domain-containing protein [Neobacillus sp. PS3-40]|uniref:lytic transglycosylase domain-containing protein n=1 Tax=Neobacillus sp. PS3-40 TaxID=3070679 RepID=UPI0027E128D6|nr:lytic transglycosylase domain-containing protein [Neobacillus sp. PS3-40]WML43393.1 lytic transglycosylase domain-containing protein [Neobacillus sp. PS3-40]
MNIDKLKVMLELKAVQTFSTTSTDNSSIFQDLLSELMSNSNVSQTLSNNVSSPLTSIAKTSLPPISLLKTDSSNLDNIINKASQAYDIPAKLIKSVIKHESNFNPNAVSNAGASGLMQLMPETARSLGAENPLDPEQNILAGSKYLKQMLDKYDNNINLALAAYNAGPGNVDKYGGIPPFKETQNYVRNITNSFYG